MLVNNPDAVSTVISAARSQIGVPYRWGRATPGVGFDCSGLTMWAYGKAGISLPHFTGLQVTRGEAVTRDQLQPGDLVFPDSHHVQIYSGNGMIIEAPMTGLNVREVPMWGFWKARRIVASTSVQGFSPTGIAGDVASKVESLIPGLPSFSDLFANSRHFMIRVIEVVLGGALIIAGVSSIAANTKAGREAIGTITRVGKAALK